VVEALHAAAYVVGRAWTWEPALLAWVVLVRAATALTPALQVLVVAWLVRSSEGGLRTAAAPLVVLVALLFTTGAMGTLDGTSQSRLDFRVERRYLARLLDAVGCRSPQELAQPSTVATVEACRSASFELAYMVNTVVVALATVVTALTLSASVWTLSPVAGVLVGLALVPGVVSAARVARRQDAIFVPYGQARRRASYLTEQLVHPRTATELATLGTSRQVAGLADAARARAVVLRDTILAATARGELLGALVTTALLGVALVLTVTDAGAAGVAAGVLGVVSGTAATRRGGYAFGSVVTNAPKVVRYRDFVEAGREAFENDEDLHVTHHVADLRLRDVQVTYPGSSAPALTGFDLHVRAGSMVALVGVNGAGKTTAINAAMGTLDLDHGTVLMDGADAAKMTSADRLSCFGLLTQEFGRFELTVRQAVQLGTPEPADDVDIWGALEAARLSDLVRGLPDGLDTQLGTQFDGPGLSGGQWQRLALARIYLRGAAIWVLDEPTSAIDAEAEQQIFAELAARRAERITLVVSHRAWTLKGMDHIYVLDHGRVVEHGRYDDLLAAHGRFAEIFADQT
jgi:ATP-binding cassette, subfamily B, bacterial